MGIIAILLPQSPKFGDYRWMPPHPGKLTVFGCWPRQREGQRWHFSPSPTPQQVQMDDLHLPWRIPWVWEEGTWPWHQSVHHILSSTTWWQTGALAFPLNFRLHHPSCMPWNETIEIPWPPAGLGSLWACSHWVCRGSPAVDTTDCSQVPPSQLYKIITSICKDQEKI